MTTSAVELQGREVLTMRELAERVSKHLGRVFPVGRITRDADIEGMTAHCVSHDFANLISDTWDAYIRYGLLRAEPPSVSVNGLTSIDDFIREQLMPAMKASDRPALSQAG